MSWMAGVALLSLAAGSRDSRKSREEMRKARRLSREQLEFSMDRWEHFRANYAPLEQQLIQEAMTGVTPDYEQITGQVHADVENQFGQQRDANQREAMAMGLDPSSGRFASGDRQMDIEQATASAMGQNQVRMQERNRAEDESFRRKAAVFGRGAEMGGQAAQGVNQARGNLISLGARSGERFAASADNLFEQAGMMGMYAAQNYADQPDPAANQNNSMMSDGGMFGQDPFQESWYSQNPNPFESGNRYGSYDSYGGDYYGTGG